MFVFTIYTKFESEDLKEWYYNHYLACLRPLTHLIFYRGSKSRSFLQEILTKKSRTFTFESRTFRTFCHPDSKVARSRKGINEQKNTLFQNSYFFGWSDWESINNKQSLLFKIQKYVCYNFTEYYGTLNGHQYKEFTLSSW